MLGRASAFVSSTAAMFQNNLNLRYGVEQPAHQSSTALLNQLLGPGLVGSWDDLKVSGPVVRQITGKSEWKLWYYGRSSEFNATEGLINLPSGHIGLAVSDDGLLWEKRRGSVDGGAVFGPNREDAAAFDSLHVGIGDIQWEDDKYAMYYFGGDREYGPTPYGRARGIHMRIGKAESLDGVSWKRSPGILLDRGAAGDFDELFCGWPQIVNVEGIIPNCRFAMYYHTFNIRSFQFQVGVATSMDRKTWTKGGPIKLPGGPSGSWRDFGHATRCVVRDPAQRHKLLMFTEAANSQGRNCIAAYGSDDGYSFHDLFDDPIFQGAGLGTGRWDAQAVGCPSVIEHNGCFYMYYVGFTEATSEGAALGCIGLVISEGFDLTMWRRPGEK